MRRRNAFALVLLAVGCTSMQEQYSVRRTTVSCEDANRYAFQAVQSLGYDVAEFRLATLGTAGVIKARKSKEEAGVDRATVDIECAPNEVKLAAAADQILKQDVTFSRGFFLAFTSLADHSSETQKWQEQQTGGTTSGGAKFEIKPQIGLESKLDFGEDLAGAGILAVKVRVQNGSERTYRLDPAAIELRPAEGSAKIAQMSPSQAAAALARAAKDAGDGAPPPDPQRLENLLRERLLAARTLRPGDQAEGFLYFPAGRYARARATLVDVETSETEGFLVEF